MEKKGTEMNQMDKDELDDSPEPGRIEPEVSEVEAGDPGGMLPDRSSASRRAVRPERKRFSAVWIGLILIAALITAIGYAYYRELTNELWSVIGAPAAYLSKYQKVVFTLKFETQREKILAQNEAMTERAVVPIRDGDTPQTVAAHMKSAGIIADEALFLEYLVYRGIDRRLVPSQYVIPERSSLKEAAEALISSNQRLLQYGILPGLRLEEIAATFSSYGMSFSGEDFLTLARNYPASRHPTGGTSLEGYLLSGSYLIHQAISPESFLEGMVRTFEEAITPEIRDGLARQGLTLDQGVILASMVTREAALSSEYGLIASVFINRFHAGMKYQCDPTVQYALGYDQELASWWKPSLTYEDLAIDSRYNTYVYAGFPPTAISNFSIEALEAVANPVRSNYLYFRASCDHLQSHNFSETYAEHVAKECK